MTQYVQIVLTGRDGSTWNLAGPNAGKQGVTLSPVIQGFIDAPVKTLWIPGPFGEEYAGKRPQRRDMVFTVRSYDGDPLTWQQIDSRWRWAWDYDTESQLAVTTAQGTRTLGVRLLEAPKAYDAKDPHITQDNPVVMTVAASFPYWVGAPLTFEWTTSASSDSSTWFFSNLGDIDVYPSYVATSPGVWTLPDFSWGSQLYARAVQDSERTVALPALMPGENVLVDSDPRVQTLTSVINTPVMQRWRGQDLLYPIAAGASGTVPVSVSGAVGGAAIRATIPQWFSRPWSVPTTIPYES